MQRRRSRHQFTGENASKIDLTVTERDRRIFDALDPQYGFVYLPSHWLSAILREKHTKVVHRYGELSRAPHDYLIRLKLQSQQARHLLTTHQKTPPHKDIPHQLLIDMVTASIYLGIRADPALDITIWRDILESDYLPPSTRLSDNPFEVPLTGSKLVFDGRPLIIHNPKKPTSYLMEIDRNNTPINPQDKTRSSIKRKLTAYQQFMQTRAYETHFGFDNCLVPFITTKEAHMHIIMKYVDAAIGPCPWLLFSHIPDWYLDRYYLQPSGFMVTREYLRVGYPPFRIDRD